MAITILGYPQTYTPIYNNIVWTVDSTNKTNCNFKYVCDIYVNGTYVTRLKLFPAGTNGYASFKVNRVLEDFVSHDLQNNLFGFGFNSNSACYYVLKFGEEYDVSVGCDAGTIIYPNLTLSSTAYALNIALQYKEWLDWDYTEYTSFSSTIKKFLTNTPNKCLVGAGQQLVVNFLNKDSNKFKYLQIKTYNSNGLAHTTVITNPYTTPGSDITKLVQSIGIGPDNLNNSTLSTGSQPVISLSIDYYTIQLLDSTSAATSPLLRLDIDKRMSVWEPNRIWWLNRLGGFDSYAFTMKNTKIVSSTRTEMQRLLGGFSTSLSPDSFTYNIGDRGRTTISVDSKESNTYLSNWLTQEEANWMQELFTSPEVYMSRVNTPVFYTDVTAAPGSPDTIRIHFNEDYKFKFEVGDSVRINSCGDTFYLDSTVTEANYTTVPYYVDLGTGYDPETITGQGTITLLGATSELDPIIIKSTSYEEKSKHNVKNINYTIEVEKAYPINVQRN